MNDVRRLRFWAIGLLAALAIVAGCGGDDGGGDQAGGKVDTINEGTLTVGSDIPYPPFEFGRAPDYKGFDIDIVNAVAKELELEVRIVKTPFDPIFRNLAQGRFDMVASAATITPEREGTVAFSVPYFNADQSLMVKKGSEVKTVEDLAGKVIGAQLGTTGAMYAKEETDAKTVRTYDLIDDAFKALQAGQIEAVINDFPVSKYAERSKPELQVVQTIATGEEYGLAFAKKSTELRRAVRDAVNEIKKNGTYAEIYRKWFQEDPPESLLETNGQSGSS
jgi:ABC-type amino acid transport substrate-binding protein